MCILLDLLSNIWIDRFVCNIQCSVLNFNNKETTANGTADREAAKVKYNPAMKSFSFKLQICSM